jgi:hypothetical protein
VQRTAVLLVRKLYFNVGNGVTLIEKYCDTCAKKIKYVDLSSSLAFDIRLRKINTIFIMQQVKLWNKTQLTRYFYLI